MNVADILHPNPSLTAVPAHCRVVTRNTLTSPSRAGNAYGPRVPVDEYLAAFTDTSVALTAADFEQRLGVHRTTANNHLRRLAAARVLKRTHAPFRGEPDYYQLRT